MATASTQLHQILVDGKPRPGTLFNDLKYQAETTTIEVDVELIPSAAQQLSRVGDTLQKIFYDYRETFFDEIIDRVEKIDGRLYINFPVSHPLGAVLDLPFAFPAHLCATLEDKHAVLSYLKCEDSLLWMHHVMKYMLRGMY
jgi:hypothetical protein